MKGKKTWTNACKKRIQTTVLKIGTLYDHHGSCAFVFCIFVFVLGFTALHEMALRVEKRRDKKEERQKTCHTKCSPDLIMPNEHVDNFLGNTITCASWLKDKDRFSDKHVFVSHSMSHLPFLHSTKTFIYSHLSNLTIDQHRQQSRYSITIYCRITMENVCFPYWTGLPCHVYICVCVCAVHCALATYERPTNHAEWIHNVSAPSFDRSFHWIWRECDAEPLIYVNKLFDMYIDNCICAMYSTCGIYLHQQHIIKWAFMGSVQQENSTFVPNSFYGICWELFSVDFLQGFNIFTIVMFV